MKNKARILAFLAVLAASLSCGDKAGGTEGGNSAAAKANIPAAAGRVYDCKYFTMTVAQGWEAGPLTFGMVNVLPKGKVSPGLYFKFEGDGNAAGTAEASIHSMIQGYGGSPMEDTAIAGIAFKTATYTYNGMTQTMHVAFRNGTKITITIEGASARDNPDIQAMLGTLVLKKKRKEK
jgi:hypothetical protein